MIQKRLREKAKQLLLLPGVYLMKDDLGNIIYVGKSKALKRRVSSYFGGGKKSKKVVRMVRCIRDFEVRYTDTELEALLLECRLIKEIKPIYNKLLKQDHRYRYIYLNPKETRPRLKLMREKEKKEGIYFGPYERGNSLYEGIQLLNRIYHLPNCKPSEIKENCLTYKRGQCIGPCKMPYDKKLFEAQLQQVIGFLEGNHKNVFIQYEAQMQQAAQILEFEKAQQLKEEWQLLKGLQFKKDAVALAKNNQLFIFKLPMEKGGNKLFLMQGYRILYSASLPSSKQDKEKLIENILEAYRVLDIKSELCLDKGRVDEIYILYGCLKSAGNKNQVRVDVEEGEKLGQEKLESLLREIV